MTIDHFVIFFRGPHVWNSISYLLGQASHASVLYRFDLASMATSWRRFGEYVLWLVGEVEMCLYGGKKSEKNIENLSRVKN